jgi:quaternary ammonium compound-resistance protein SugE
MGYWGILVIAGLLETGWAIGLKYTDGFTRFWPSVWTSVAIAASMFLLSVAARGIPIGTAYGVWVGIGACGTLVLGVILFNEPVTALRLVFALLLIVAIAGLKWTAGPMLETKF